MVAVPTSSAAESVTSANVKVSVRPASMSTSGTLTVLSVVVRQGSVTVTWKLISFEYVTPVPG